MLDKEWFPPAELADMALPDVPATKRGVQLMADAGRWLRSDWQDRYWRLRQGRGGGVEYHYTVLPPAARAAVTVRFTSVDEPARPANAEAVREALAARFEALPDKAKAKARERLRALQAVEAQHLAGTPLCVARLEIARELGIAPSSLSNWAAKIQHVPARDRLYHLISHHVGRVDTAECSDEAWQWLQSAYLRPKATFEQCWDDLVELAKEHRWTLPSKRTLQRRLGAVPEAVKVYKREGTKALERMYPAQERDYTVLHAMEAVTADGHQVDTFVQLPWRKDPSRLILICWQDLYSGKILSWRLDETENKDVIRLAFGDMVERYGVPDHAYLDNGKAFMSKWMTGGMKHRFRFKIKDEDPEGIMTQLGVKVHAVTPYHGQAKRIERRFKDIAQRVANDLRFDGAHTGNNPMNKPHNYGKRAIPLADFVKIMGERIEQINAKPGRDTKVNAGRSYDETFRESFEQSAPKIVTAEQRRLWLLAAEGVMASKVDGSLRLLDNRYWSPFLHEHRGQKLVVRFDPQRVKQDLFVYRLDGSFLGAAECKDASGYNDTDAAREIMRNRRKFARAVREQAEALIEMPLSKAAAMLNKLPQPEPEAPPEAKIVRPVFATRGNTALAPIPQQQEEDDPEEVTIFEALREMNRNLRGAGHLRAVTDTDGD